MISNQLPEMLYEITCDGFFKDMNEDMNNPFGFCPQRFLFVAKSNSGKSWILKQLLYDLRFIYQKGYVICPTEMEQSFYSKFINKANIYYDTDEQVVEKIFIQQSQQTKYINQEGNYVNTLFRFIPPQMLYLVRDVKSNQQKIKQNEYPNYNMQQVTYLNNIYNYYKLFIICRNKILKIFNKQDLDIEKKKQVICQLINIQINQYSQLNEDKISKLIWRLFQERNASSFIVFDDCISDAKFTKKAIMSKLLMQGRHSQISVFLTTQHLNAVDSKLRTNFGFIIISKQDSADIIEVIRKQYVSFIKKDLFNQLIDKFTQNYNCVVIDNFNNYDNSIDKIKCYRATDLSGQSFKLGSIMQQIYNQQVKEISFHDQHDIKQLTKQKKQIDINELKL